MANKIRLAFMLLLVLVSACQPSPAATEVSTPVPTTTQTPAPAPTPTPIPALEVSEVLSVEGESYTSEQLLIISSIDFEEKLMVINNWWLYWAYAAEDQQPFHPESKNIHIVPFFEEENPESYSLAIEAKMDDGNWHTFLLPITGDIRWTESFGWVRLDESGKMAEFINMETGQWKKMESVTFSERYPVTWHEGYVAKVGEMEIPIDIGLHYKVRQRTEEPISEIHIAPDMVDAVGDYFMHMCFWRYTQLMDNPDVTYEQYLELVAKGEGKVEILTYDEDKPDQEYAEKNLIDPRKGFY